MEIAKAAEKLEVSVFLFPFSSHQVLMGALSTHVQGHALKS